MDSARYYIYGAGGHGKVVYENLLAAGNKTIAFFDDNFQETFFMGVPVLTWTPLVLDKDKLIIAIGNNRTRKQVAESIRVSCFGKGIHPSAILSPSCKIENGTVVMPAVVVNACANIGQHVILNTHSTIEHDCTIEDYVHVCPNVAIAGNVRIGEGTQVGIGASIIQGITIGKWCTIAAGAVVINDVPDYAMVAGVPATIRKYQ